MQQQCKSCCMRLDTVQAAHDADRVSQISSYFQTLYVALDFSKKTMDPPGQETRFLNWPRAAYKDNIAHLCAQKGILKCARCHCQDLLKTKRDQSCGEDLLSLTKCPCKAGDLVQDKQQGRQRRCGDCGSSARGQMKGCNSLAEQGRKDRWGGKPQLQAKDVNTARMGRGWGRGWGPVPHQA